MDINAIKAIALRGIRFFPEMKNIKVIRTYAGLRPYPDHLPIVSDTKVPGFYIMVMRRWSWFIIDYR